MRWTPGGPSADVEDRRGQAYGGGFRGGPASIGIILVLLVLSLLTGRNFLALLGPGGVETTEPRPRAADRPPTSRQRRSASFNSSTSSWTMHRRRGSSCWGTDIGRRQSWCFAGRRRRRAASGSRRWARSIVRLDEKVYIDLGFYDELRRRFGAPGDFAQAYVITHELGHHVQHLRGIDAQVRQLQEARPDAANQLSVRLELQADCLAGVWGHSTAQRDILEQGDVEEALNAASAIGDDRIQSSVGRGVQPDSFTHGSSEQRVQWFRRGLESGDVNSCDTFGRGSD